MPITEAILTHSTVWLPTGTLGAQVDALLSAVAKVPAQLAVVIVGVVGAVGTLMTIFLKVQVGFIYVLLYERFI